jgi:hypothetical protein
MARRQHLPISPRQRMSRWSALELGYSWSPLTAPMQKKRDDVSPPVMKATGGIQLSCPVWDRKTYFQATLGLSGCWLMPFFLRNGRSQRRHNEPGLQSLCHSAAWELSRHQRAADDTSRCICKRALRRFAETWRGGSRIGWRGLIYDSLRRQAGVNVVAHRPRIITDIVQTDHFEITVLATSRTIDVRKLSL